MPHSKRNKIHLYLVNQDKNHFHDYIEFNADDKKNSRDLLALTIKELEEKSKLTKYESS